MIHPMNNFQLLMWLCHPNPPDYLVFQVRTGWHYDLHKSLESLPLEKPKPSVVLRAEDVFSCRKPGLLVPLLWGQITKSIITSSYGISGL